VSKVVARDRITRGVTGSNQCVGGPIERVRSHEKIEIQAMARRGHAVETFCENGPLHRTHRDTGFGQCSDGTSQTSHQVTVPDMLNGKTLFGRIARLSRNALSWNQSPVQDAQHAVVTGTRNQVRPDVGLSLFRERHDRGTESIGLAGQAEKLQEHWPHGCRGTLGGLPHCESPLLTGENTP
jgi:hypothetical protein